MSGYFLLHGCGTGRFKAPVVLLWCLWEAFGCCMVGTKGQVAVKFSTLLLNTTPLPHSQYVACCVTLMHDGSQGLRLLRVVIYDSSNKQFGSSKKRKKRKLKEAFTTLKLFTRSHGFAFIFSFPRMILDFSCKWPCLHHCSWLMSSVHARHVMCARERANGSTFLNTAMVFTLGKNVGRASYFSFSSIYSACPPPTVWCKMLKQCRSLKSCSRRFLSQFYTNIW